MLSSNVPDDKLMLDKFAEFNLAGGKLPLIGGGGHIGAPELLSALTDITSFSSGRVTTYCLLLIFYTVVVMGVVWLCNRLRSFLEHNEATA